MVGKTKQLAVKVKEFLCSDVWDIDISSTSVKHSIIIRVIRVAQLVVKGFKEDDLAVHASALTFTSLMSLVPILAVAFALLKGFGFGQQEIDKLLQWKDGMPDQFQNFFDQMLHIVNSTNFSALGWIGLGFVVFTAIMVLGSIENSFNRIWGISTSRSLIRKVTNYISVLVLVPLLIGIASTLEASLRSGALLLPESVGFLVRNLLGLTSLFTTWLAFLFLYMFVPNTRVKFAPALSGGLCAALLWLLWQKLYIILQIGVARYNAIYGTFASVPIFLAWLYASWVIVLLGAEFAFALQNFATYQMEGAADRASARSRLILALAIVQHAARALSDNAPKFDTSVFAKTYRVPIRLLNDIVRLLEHAGYMAETAEKQGTYVLLKTPSSVSLKELVDLILQAGARPESLGLDHIAPAMESIVAKVEAGMQSNIEAMTLQDLITLKDIAPGADGVHA